jgi:hypothetical protein
MSAASASCSVTGLARQLVERLSSRLANEKRELVLFLIELAEFDAKKLALELGYPSTLGCLVGELGLTESSACRRIAAARLLAQFPQIAPQLLASRLTLMGLVALKDVLDEANVDDVLERAAGLSESDVRQLVMRIRLAVAAPSPSVEASPAQLQVATTPAARVAADRVATCHANESLPAAPAEDREAVTLWVGPSFREELEAVRALLSHAVPSGKKEDVLLHVLRAQRKVLERRRHGSPKRKPAPAAPANTPTKAHVAKPQAVAPAQCHASDAAWHEASAVAPTPAHASDAAWHEAVAPAPAASDAASPESRQHIPAAVRREVFNREGGSCAFVGEEGRRCGSTLRLEYQHIVPVARGGRSSPENLTLFCRSHNQLQADKDFGAEHVTQRRAVSALTNLGYKRALAEQAVRQLPPTSDLTTLVRQCLRLLE